jgi:hypothetical protein
MELKITTIIVLILVSLLIGGGLGIWLGIVIEKGRSKDGYKRYPIRSSSRKGVRGCSKGKKCKCKGPGYEYIAHGSSDNDLKTAVL